MTDVKLRHPDADTNHQITVRADLRDEYEQNGWVEVGADKVEADKK